MCSYIVASRVLSSNLSCFISCVWSLLLTHSLMLVASTLFLMSVVSVVCILLSRLFPFFVHLIVVVVKLVGITLPTSLAFMGNHCLLVFAG